MKKLVMETASGEILMMTSFDSQSTLTHRKE